eukprot:2645624-Ditylum_brightwellii.AAC.1
MQQGDTELNDRFLKLFKVNAQTLELAGGEHIFCSEQLEGSSVSSDNNKKAIERFKAVLFMKQSDPGRYR